ncbi:MAG: DUF1576 domain-containing protein [Snowella sp.]
MFLFAELIFFIILWDHLFYGFLLAALFGTTLAPIAGKYGWSWGIIAGFLHCSAAQSEGVLHGGLNLYNNGFAAGIVATTLVPIIQSFDKIRQNQA